MFSSPALLLSSILATLWAALFHLLLGQQWVELVLHWFVGLVGFLVGQAMGDILGWNGLMIGQVHLLEGTCACWIAMLVARWLKV
jgi:hypothetical protein